RHTRWPRDWSSDVCSSDLVRAFPTERILELARRMLPGSARQLENPLRRKGADGQVVVARPAEAAQIRAPADDLHEEARSELGVEIGRASGRERVEISGRAE